MTPEEAAPPAGAPASEPAGETLQKSPLNAAHEALGAKLVPFGGWLMPLAYEHGTLAEHRACRTSAVVFDVSHLGTVRVAGQGAFEALQGVLTNDLRKIAPGRAQYTHLLDPIDGSVVDDIIVWWLARDVFDVMPNASNTKSVRGALPGTDTTAGRAVLAVQGPTARRLLAPVAPEAAAVGHFQVTTFTWQGATCTAAGTGYTGEDGVECALPAEHAQSFWDAVVAGGVTPAGLGARDTLRLEAGLPLHGHELGPGITPLQAGLGWVVGWDKGDFRGRDALVEERDRGVARRLRGIVAEGRQPPRQGDPVLHKDSRVGTVTSGNFSPVLNRGIAMAFVDTSTAVENGDGLDVEVRGRHLTVTITAMPFVKRGESVENGGGT